MVDQKVLLLNYLIKNKSITGLEALTKLGIMSYTKRISQLRDMGVVIESEWCTKKSKFGLKRFVRYNLLKLPKDVKRMLSR